MAPPVGAIRVDPDALLDAVSEIGAAVAGLATARAVLESANDRLQDGAVLEQGGDGVQQALDVLVESDDRAPLGPATADADPLVHAALEVRADGGARPSLWRRLHAEGLWLAVLDADAGAAGIEIRLLTILHEGGAFVIGASSERGLASLLGDRTDEARLIHAPGHHLPRIWPRGHHLVLDPGTTHAVVVSPAEMVGLPAVR